MNRREFLKSGGAGVLMLAGAPRCPARVGTQDPADEVWDPRTPEGFVQPFPRAGERGLFPLLRPTGPLTLEAKPVTASFAAGARGPLLAYVPSGAGHEGGGWRERMSVRSGAMNPILLAAQGEELQVRMVNRLAQDTIIHWHGLILDGKNDGVPPDAVAPGSVYDYRFTVANRAGTYWYHPHPFEFTSEQAYRGLASFFIVDDPEERALRAALGLDLGTDDLPVLLQDKKFDARGELSYEPTEEEWRMGFLGDRILVNLVLKPRLAVRPGLVRFRLLNGANARIFRLAFEAGGVRLPFSVLGNDGGLLGAAEPAPEAFLAPGERLDVLIDLSAAGPAAPVYLKSLPFDPMDQESMAPMAMDPGLAAGIANGEELYLMRIEVTGAPRARAALPERLGTVLPIETAGAAVRPVLLAQSPDGTAWTIDGERYAIEAFPLEVARGTVEVWAIENAMQSMPHPMHLHGFQFQVIGREGSPGQVMALAADRGLLPSDLGWKDTVLVWPGETVRVAIDFSHPFAGEQRYVFHCHNLEHEDMGMMINYRVV